MSWPSLLCHGPFKEHVDGYREVGGGDEKPIKKFSNTKTIGKVY
jgi:hypothetical protein